MLKNFKEQKEKIMDLLCIPSSRYRVNKKIEFIKNTHYKVILKYFNVSNNFNYLNNSTIISTKNNDGTFINDLFIALSKFNLLTLNIM